MKWRFAGKLDADWLLELGKKHHEESDWSEVEFSEDKGKKYIHAATNDPTYFGIVLEEDDERIGFMAGRLIEYPFSYKLFARELDLYVVPKHRKGMAGMFMMRKFIEWAKINKALEVVFEPRLSDKHIKKFDAMARRLGMKHFANAYRIKL